MSLSTRQIGAPDGASRGAPDGAQSGVRRRSRLPGDPGRPLTARGGLSRIIRIIGSTLLIAILTVPLVPLALWTIADRWDFPAILPTRIGLNGARVALDQGAVSAGFTSLGLALCVAAIATPLGAIAARSLVRGWAPAPRLLTVLLIAPVALPPLAAVFGVNVLLLRAGVPSMVGVIGVLVVVAIPYTTFSMRLAYAAHDLRFEEEARCLGASAHYVFWHVHLPLLATAIARSAFFAFLVGWNDYLVTLIIGGGQLVTLPIITASLATAIGNSSAVAVLSLVGMLVPVLLIGLLAIRGRYHSRGTR